MKILILIFFSLSLNVCLSQNRSEMAAYNIGLGSIFSGVGAVINKNPNEKTGKVFLKGLWQGALGGYLIYESKNLISKIAEKESWSYSWAAKLTNAAGTSVVENAASNRNFWEQWHLNFGFNRIELYTKEGFKVRYKVMPISLALTISTAIDNKLEFSSSLQRGEMIFSNKQLKSNIEFSSGYTLGNVIVIKKENLGNYLIFSHEVIHIYQYYDFNFLNTYLKKTYSNWSNRSEFFNNINNWVYVDLNGPVLRGLYLIEGTKNSNYYDNFFEYEAEFYSTNGNVNSD